MAVLSSKERKALPKKDFALGKGKSGGSGSYPIPNEAHARNALSRVAQNGSPSEIARVRAAVHAKFPNIGNMNEDNVRSKQNARIHK